MYVLNLDTDGRVLSATFPEFAPVGAAAVKALPEGNIADYRYGDGEYVYDPLPAPETPAAGSTTGESIEARLSKLESLLGRFMSSLPSAE